MTSAADLVVAHMAAADYRAMSVRLERESRLNQAKGQPLTARIISHWAFLARNAARGEEANPDTVGFDGETV